jgi:hypothetical protein
LNGARELNAEGQKQNPTNQHALHRSRFAANLHAP